jgi:hypothetical protein
MSCTSGDIHLARLLGVEERVHGARQRAHRATAADAFAIQAFEEVHVTAHVMIEHGDVAAGHVRHRHLVFILHKLAEDATHRNHVVVGVRRKANDLLASRQLALAADLRAQRIEDEAVDGAGAAMARDQRCQLMFGVVVLCQLENGLVRLFRQPCHRAKLQRFGPVDFIDQPRRGNARQVGGRRIVHKKRGVRMPLQERRGHRAIHFAFHRTAHDAGLVLTGGKNRNLARGENGRDPHRDRFARHVTLAEEVGGGIASRDAVEMNQPRATRLTRPRLVESDVAGLADAQQLEIDAARRDNGGFIRTALRVHLLARPRPIRDVYVRGIDIHVREQILPHEAMVRVNARRWHRPVFVEVERDHTSKAQPFVAMQTNELAIHANRSGAGGESEHDRPFVFGAGANDGGDSARHLAGQGVVGINHHGADAFTRRAVGAAVRSIWGSHGRECAQARALRRVRGPVLFMVFRPRTF